jgi:hypothetical protein
MDSVPYQDATHAMQNYLMYDREKYGGMSLDQVRRAFRKEIHLPARDDDDAEDEEDDEEQDDKEEGDDNYNDDGGEREEES